MEVAQQIIAKYLSHLLPLSYQDLIHPRILHWQFYSQRSRGRWCQIGEKLCL